MTVGFADTEVPVVEDKPVAGLQEYVAPPLAVSVVLVPLQIVAEAALTEIIGVAFTVTVTGLLELSQPFIR